MLYVLAQPGCGHEWILVDRRRPHVRPMVVVVTPSTALCRRRRLGVESPLQVRRRWNGRDVSSPAADAGGRAGELGAVNVDGDSCGGWRPLPVDEGVLDETAGGC